ncbi:hypothetical protein HanPI659440_Chr05g0217211 [Helianthus annuus]|uniref:Uncharacterized protein n=1 Tax=Helianthus annuus TaxID=4232 RepID=A0A9K3NP97_HELAN|nr:hypothetical protein HanXRQr2_Chr05g0236001 [Helianthus annuus]KAJ0571744.1 hypothetical protein HanHA300_Chr05g0193511 [Helianthus annuus]KAJ0578951.1 hypothetical protein HanIR_Chr05g0253531 [Helianthus annuus]KAJ0586120.1 hypothetical protein HanHA89_Chr05g0208331 [Helianthus annuus]KAJ0790607.1 hypothetical protein HanPI659440_Chr05g0217211 [Helianthus annuus]
MALWNQVGSPERVCLEVLAGELAEKMTWLLRSQHHWLEGPHGKPSEVLVADATKSCTY